MMDIDEIAWVARWFGGAVAGQSADRHVAADPGHAARGPQQVVE